MNSYADFLSLDIESLGKIYLLFHPDVKVHAGNVSD